MLSSSSDFRMEDYFIPRYSTSISMSTIGDADNNYHNCCSKHIARIDITRTKRDNECKGRHKRIEDSEIGIKMHVASRSPKPEIPSLESRRITQLPNAQTVYPNNCCHHEHKGLQKFMCNFSATVVPYAGVDCMAEEKMRCQAFWKFIDSQPELQELIKEGEYEYLNLPVQIKSQNKDTSERCERAEELRARHKAQHDEERERLAKRKQFNNELQIKSGQEIIISKPKEKVRKDSDELQYNCDLVSEPFSKIMEEMNIFDATCGNFVRTPYNPPSKSNSDENFEE